MEKSWCFHLSLNVANLTRAIDFYRVVFGMAPAKCHDDYAKFEVVDPPVVFSLVPHAVGPTGARSQIGLRLASLEQVLQVRGRLEEKGIAVRASADVDGAFGVIDPDGNAWQFSVGDEAPGWETPTSVPSAVPGPAPGEPVTWEHYVTAPLPERIEFDSGTVDEVRLTGTFNGPHQERDRQKLIEESFRVLKPGGKVVVHGLAADKPFPGTMPTLPGLAAMVSQVPLHNDVPSSLARVGFTNLQFVKFTEKAWFEHDGVEMREIKVVGWKPLTAPSPAPREVIYRGPFRQVCDDQGNACARGQRVAIAPQTWTMLRQSPQAEQFLFLEPSQAAQTCGTH